jgi:hypothetical protein
MINAITEWYDKCNQDYNSKHFEVSAVSDITERKLADGMIKSLPYEKELLLREVHHRIKNHTNVAMSHLSLHSSKLKKPPTIDAGKVESTIEIAKMVLNPDNKVWDDLDCAGLALQEVLTLDPENTEAASLLKEIITEIDKRFDAGDITGIACHLIGGWESPSPHVRAQEIAERQAKRK